MPKTIKNKVSIGLILLLWVFLVIPCAAAQEMSAPVRRVEYQYAFRPGVHDYPTWNQGYLVAWEPDTSPSDANENLAVFDRDGKLVGKTRIWLQDASFLRIEDAAARKDGNVAVVGWAMTKSGTIASFLADVSVVRNSGRITQTSPFEGQAVAFGPDGTIWVLGSQVGPGRGKESAPDHYIVQHFGADDVLSGQHLLRSTISCGVDPALGIGGNPRILTSSDRIGLFSPACRMWIELNPRGELLGQWKWSDQSPGTNAASKVRVRTAVLTPANELYARLDLPKGYGLFRFDRESSSWVPVDTDVAKNVGAPFSWLVGTDGDALVYATSGQKLAWARPTKLE